MKRSVRMILVGAVVAMVGCGGGGGGGSDGQSTGGGTCGERLSTSKLCQFSCTPGSRTSIAQATELLKGLGVSPYLNADNTTSIIFHCVDDGTTNWQDYNFDFGTGDYGLNGIYYAGHGSYPSSLPSCIVGCALTP